MAPKVFLSYARDDDEPFVHKLRDDLAEAGFKVWLDRRSMSSRGLTFHQEIRDAIMESDRLILIVGPHALRSDYVTQEWQFAYFAANKCVNPIIRLDGKDADGRAVDGRALVPEDLKLLHAEDFRDDAHYMASLQNLIRQLSERLKPVGKLVAVPELPPGYRAQPERLRALRDLLLIDLRKPVVVSGATARVGLQGMGGIGKSVLANALAHHPEVQRAFKDNIFWISLGQTPRIEDLQRWLARQLGDAGDFADSRAGKEKLRELLAERAALLILDDVWERYHADAFNVAGPRGRILLTTRDAGLVTALAARENHYRVELPTQAEAETLIAAAAEVPPEALPPEAHEIITQCDRLPLALALCGGMVHAGTAWSHVLEALREHDLEFLSVDHPSEEHHRNAWVAMDASLRMLTEEQRNRFAELAVFASDTAVPEAAVTVLWGHTSGMAPRHVAELLAQFTRRALLQEVRSADGVRGGWDMHDLVHNFAEGRAIKRLGSMDALHRKLLDAYRSKCSDGWHVGPNDGYFLQRLSGHMIAAEEWDELEALLSDLPFLELKVHHGLAFGLVRDFADAVRQLPKERPQHRIISLLEVALSRDIQFIHDHRKDYPQALFQSIWNSGWWYDCPQAGEHGELPSQDCDSTTAPWQRTGPTLHQLMERWRLQREIWQPGFVWARSLFPPPTSLDAGPRLRMRGHRQRITTVSFSPNGDRIVSGSWDNTARVWDGRTGQEQFILQGHKDVGHGAKGSVECASFSLNGQIIATGGADMSVRLWDVVTGKEREVLLGHTGPVNSVSISPDGSLLASSSEYDGVRIWGLQSGLRRHHNRGGASAVKFAPSGEFFAYCQGDKVVVEDTFSGERWCDLVLQRAGTPVELAFSPDGDVLAVVMMHGLVELWDSRAIFHHLLERGTGYSPLIGPEVPMEFLLIRTKDIAVWSSPAGPLRTILRGNVFPSSASFAPNSEQLALGDYDGYVRLWNVRAGAEIAVRHGHEAAVLSVSFAPDGEYVVSGSGDGSLAVWNIQQPRGPIRMRGEGELVRRVVVSPDGDAFISIGGNNARLWNSQKGKVIQELGDVERVAFSEDGESVAGCSAKGSITLWRTRDENPVMLRYGRSEAVLDMAFSPNGILLANAANDHAVRIWNARTGEGLEVLRGHRDLIRCLAFSPTANELATASDDGTVGIWDTNTGRLRTVLEGHGAPVGCAGYSKGGELIASGSNDRLLRLWDAKSGLELRALHGHSDGVQSLAFAQQRGLIVSASYDGVLCIWDISSSRMVSVELGAYVPRLAQVLTQLEHGEPLIRYERAEHRTTWVDPWTARLVASVPGALTERISSSDYIGTVGNSLGRVQLMGEFGCSLACIGEERFGNLMEKHGRKFGVTEALTFPRTGEESSRQAMQPFVEDMNTLYASAIDYREIKRFSKAADLLRLAIERMDAELLLDHLKRAQYLNELSIVLMLGGEMVAARGANEEAWGSRKNVGSGHDRSDGRILFMRLILLWLQGQDSYVAVGQLRTLLGHGPLPPTREDEGLWKMDDALGYIGQRLAPEKVDFLTALLRALNIHLFVPRLSSFGVWKEQPPVPLDAPWL